MEANTTIQTGTESDSRADATAVDVSPDVWAFADDEEFATTWAVERLDDTTVAVEIHRHEAGLDDVIGVEEFDVDADKTTEQFAQELADADPEEAINITRDYWA